VSRPERQPVAGRSALLLVGGSLLALAWFGFVFFGVLPAAVLWSTGADLCPPTGATRWIGGAVLVGAAALLVPPVAAFVRQGRGTQAPIAPPSRFVAGGFYARVRNPMYTLYVVIAVGEAILYRSPALVAYAAALFATAHWYVVRVEEKQLRRRFGAEYDAYCARVGRWLPRRRRPV
jgi:protein-S-isoprenylcysteine O-methyltransferase Ste14